MLSPAIAYLQIKLSNEMKPDPGTSVSVGIKPEDDLGYDVVATDPYAGKPMSMGGKPNFMSMGGKPGKPMAMGGKPNKPMAMGGKPISVGGKEEKMMMMGGKPGPLIGKANKTMMMGGKPTISNGQVDPTSLKGMEISPEEVAQMREAEQGSLASRVARTLGFGGSRLDSMDSAANLGRSAMNFV